MFDNIYMHVLDMSKVASIVILVVLLARLLLKKAPKAFSYALWAVVLFRLLCPVSFEAPVSIVPEMTSVSQGYTLSDESISVFGAGEAAYRAVGDALNGGLGIQHIRTTEKAETGMTKYVTTDWWSVWILFGQYVWVAGIAAILLYGAVSYLKVRKKLSVVVPLRDNIFIADDIKSPFVVGLFRPKIYLPCNLGEKEQEYIILHEQHHIKRLDHVVKALAFLALSIHWFNPLVWVAFIYSNKDMEMSCDEAVIRKVGGDVRADYSASLLTLATGRRIIAGTPLAFGEGDTKGRINNLSKWKKPAFWVVLVAVVACVVLAVSLLTNPVGFRFDETTHTIVSASYFDMRTADDALVVEMNPSQLSELSSRLAGVKKAKNGDKYAGLTPGYQISALLEDGTYIRISGYSLSDNNMVDIEWNGERYVVSDAEFQDYLSRICGGADVSAADNAVAGKTYVYEGEGIMGSFTITLYDDGTFTYYEGMASSYIGIGSWEQDGDTITLTDDGYGGYGLVNHFKLDGDDLVFVEQDSDNFIYVKVKNGEKFYRTGEAFKQNDSTDGSMQIMPSRKLTLDDVVALSQKGQDLTWSDFGGYSYIETGSGLYIRVYEINEMYQLWIGGGSTDSDPMYIYLALADDIDTRIDIRDGGVTDFISDHNNFTGDFSGVLHLGLNAEIIDIDYDQKILYVKDMDKLASVFGDRCAIDCTHAISRYNLMYVNYGDANDVRTIDFSDFEIGDAVIIGMYDSEKQKAFNGSAVAEQAQLSTQKLPSESAPDGYYVQEMGRTFKYKYELTGIIPGTQEVTTIVFYADVYGISFDDVASVLDGFDEGEEPLDIYVEEKGAFR